MSGTGHRAAETRAYAAIALGAIACAGAFAVLADAGPVPVVGSVPMLPLTALAAIIGLPLLRDLASRAAGSLELRRVDSGCALLVLVLGFALALPPIAIDIATRFPVDINLPPPLSLLFYPAIALVAEVVFHLIPLAVLAAMTSQRLSSAWVLVPVILAEPLFQAAYASEAGLQAWLVLGNVTLVSAVQLWLFLRYGFVAMFALRLSFYLFWHVAWGSARLDLLF